MKKKLLSLVLCFSLLSSLTVSASAEFSSSDSTNLRDSRNFLQSIWSELNPNLSSSYSTNLRKIVGQILAKLPSSDYADVLTSRASFNNSSYSNFVVMLGNALTSLYNSSSGISERILVVRDTITGTNNRLDTVDGRLSTINTNMQNLIAAASRQNHADWTNFFTGATVPWSIYRSLDDPYVVLGDLTLPLTLGHIGSALCFDSLSSASGDWSLYHRVKQLQEVLASDDDLALKNDNKANEEAATSGFVSGSSSKTSLGAGDFGNLKDIGGTFNDLSSLNGQAKISSFSSGLSSADSAGQGWFSEATRASLDAVTPSNSSRSLAPALSLVYGTYRGERSSIYSVSSDISVFPASSYVEPVFSSASPDDDPYNMGTFTDNYSWLWGG